MAVVEWKLASPELALRQLSNEPLGSPSIDHQPTAVELDSNLSVPGDDQGRFALNLRGQLSVAVLNDPTDPDEDCILSATASKTADGSLPPQLAYDGSRAYMKYRAEAGLKAVGGATIAQLLALDLRAESRAIFCDYRLHQRAEQAQTAFLFDMARGPRFVTKLADVESLEPGEALAFRFGGTIHAAVTISWTDVFTGQLGTIGKLLGTVSPLTFAIDAGAALDVDVSVTDEFVVAFSRIDPQTWRAGVRKVKMTQLGTAIEAGIEVGFTDPAQVEGLLTSVLDNLLGGPAARIKDILGAASLESLAPAERRVVAALVQRFGLEDEATSLQEIRKRVMAAEQRLHSSLGEAIRTRLALSFGYEYSRVSLETNLLQATVDQAALQAFHAELLRARTRPIVEAIAARRPGVGLEMYLNQKELTRSRSWGFTLGLGKWGTVGGKDFKKIATVRRLDGQGRVQESYLGARSYKGQWVGETFEWGVDLKAEMKDYAAQPLVADYSFGIHLLWRAEQKHLSGTELEQWLDAGVIWRVLREHDLAEVRGRLAGAIDRQATLAVHVVISNSVLRSLLPDLAAAPSTAFAPALAAAMPWLKSSLARNSAARRRYVYAPLWASYLAHPEQSLASLARAAFEHVKKEGHPELAPREISAPQGPDPLSFAGLTRVNGNTRAACDAFTRGMRILHSSIAAGARNQKTIDKAVGEMDDLWAQSHHVRAIGAYLLEAADRAGVVGDVTRTMTVEADGMSNALVVTV